MCVMLVSDANCLVDCVNFNAKDLEAGLPVEGLFLSKHEAQSFAGESK